MNLCSEAPTCFMGRHLLGLANIHSMDFITNSSLYKGFPGGSVVKNHCAMQETGV